MMKKTVIILSALLLSASAFATTRCGCRPAKPKPPGICSPQGKAALKKLVSHLNGQYVEIGQYVTMELPISQVFIGHSKNLTKCSFHALNMMAKRLACYTTKSIGVTVYTGTLPNPRANVVLASQRAKIVGTFLRHYDASRLIYEKGKCTHEPSFFCGINRIQIVTKRLT